MAGNIVNLTGLRLLRPFIPHPTHNQKRRLTDGLEDSQQRPNGHQALEIVTGGVQAEDTAPADDGSAEEFPDGEDLDELGRWRVWLAMVCLPSCRGVTEQNGEDGRG